ncbi:CHAT domain-containing protein [Trichophaea hybrida]|nr:CHAT domain-containing protein [Trichophaea hybrida]
MSESDSGLLRQCIKTSRNRCLVADYEGALTTLSTVQTDSFSWAAIFAEMARVHVLNGNYGAAKAVYPLELSPGEYLDMKLLRIQKAYVEIMTDCKLAEAADIAGEIWNSFEEVPEQGASEIEIRIFYYCLIIFNFIRIYGNRKHKRKLPINEKAQRFLDYMIAQYLFEFEGLQLEALDMVDHFADYEVANKLLSQFVERDLGPVRVDVSLMLLRISATLDEISTDDEGIKRSHAVERLSGGVMHKTGSTDARAVRLRYFETETSNLKNRIENLMTISNQYIEQGYFEKSVWALEAACELLCTPTPFDWRERTGIELHDRLQDIKQQCDDRIGLLQVQFRKCDFLNSMTPHLVQARQERQDALKSSWCFKVPALGRYHERQWAEYLMLNQYKDALYHARRYFKYSKKCLEKSEQSAAQILIFYTLFHQKRMSYDARFNSCVLLQSYLDRAIQYDQAALSRLQHKLKVQQSRTTGLEDDLDHLDCQTILNFDRKYLTMEMDRFYLSQAEKYLLKVEARENQGRLEQEENNDMVAGLQKLLARAEENCRQVVNRERARTLRSDIAMLKATILVFDESVQGSECLPNVMIYDTAEQFSYSEWNNLLALAMKYNSYAMLEKVVDIGKQKEAKIQKGGTLGQLQLFVFQATLIAVIMSLTEPEAEHIWRKVGFKSLLEGHHLLLSTIEKILQTQDELMKMLTRGSRWDELKRRQDLLTASNSTFLLEEALVVCYCLEDPKLTWLWSQRIKARAITDGFDKFRGYSGNPSSPMIATVDDMWFVQTATARKVVFIDWVTTLDNDTPFMLVALSIEFTDGSRSYWKPEYSQQTIRVSYEKVIQWTDGYRRKLYGCDAQAYLDNLKAVIAPITQCSKEGDLLVLCPTAPLHNFPLHALYLGETLLLERNPVVYTPSLMALVQCLRRLMAPEPGAEMPHSWKAAVMGTYEDTSTEEEAIKERDNIYSSLRDLARDFDDSELVGPNLSTAAFKAHASSANLIHFHGHGSYDQNDIEQQSLLLSGSDKLSLSEIIQNLELNQSPHVTIIACETAIQDFSLGRDEPLGILTAFLLAGAPSTIGSLWPIKSEDGRLFSRLFYQYFLHGDARGELGPMVNLAVGLQKAALDIRKEKPEPYHWAGYMLYGSWFCLRKPGTW